jgi:adenylyltransferase/sulfurtransferase
VQLTHGQGPGRLDFDDIAKRLRAHGEVKASPHLLRAAITDNGKPYTLSVFPDGRAIVHGTAEVGEARSVYAKYIGN